MKTPVDQQLREEARHFRLRFSCAHCAYFAEHERRCSEGYPNGEHLADTLEGQPLVVFCKRFELL